MTTTAILLELKRSMGDNERRVVEGCCYEGITDGSGDSPESLEDVYQVQRGQISADQVRRVSVQDALVDTGATGLSMPASMIRQLGLVPLRTRKALTTSGIRDVATYAAVRLTIQDRDCVCDVTEVADECPVLIGQVPLELMDYIVDPGRKQLIGNPAHGGQQMMELM